MTPSPETVSVKQVLTWTGGELLSGRMEERFAAISTDTRKIGPGMLFVALAGEKADGHRFIKNAMEAGATGLVVQQPGDLNGSSVATVIRVPDTTRALGDIARGLRLDREDLKVVGITGSAGKTTTKDLVAHLATSKFGDRVLVTEANYNNHIGVPWTIFRLAPQHTHLVVEMGMNHPGEIRYLADIARPQTALVTNVYPVHLEFLRTIQNVAAAKGEIFERLSERDTAIYNADDPWLIKLVQDKPFRKVTFGIDHPADIKAESIDSQGASGSVFTVNINGQRQEVRTKLLGAHNIYNILAALAVGVVWGINPETMTEAVRTFKPASKRTRIVKLPGGVQAIDDVYNANPRSMELALSLLADLAVGGRAFAALGDMFELGDYALAGHRRVGLAAAAASLTGLVALGDHAKTVVGQAIEEGLDPKCCRVADSHQATADWLKERLKPGDWLLVKGSRGMAMEKVLDRLREED